MRHKNYHHHHLQHHFTKLWAWTVSSRFLSPRAKVCALESTHRWGASQIQSYPVHLPWSFDHCLKVRWSRSAAPERACSAFLSLFWQTLSARYQSLLQLIVRLSCAGLVWPRASKQCSIAANSSPPGWFAWPDWFDLSFLEICRFHWSTLASSSSLWSAIWRPPRQ